MFGEGDMARGMRNKFVAARIYRDRAEELRTIADNLGHESERELLQSIAGDYERLAKAAETRGGVARCASQF